MAKGTERHRTYERVAVFVFGVVFVIGLLVLAILFSKPTDFQYMVFRIVLALAAAGVAAFIPGFIEVDVKNWVRAGGAIAVFIIVYFFSPANLVTQAIESRKNLIEQQNKERQALEIQNKDLKDQLESRKNLIEQQNKERQALEIQNKNLKDQLESQKNLIEQQNKERQALEIQNKNLKDQLAKTIGANPPPSRRGQQTVPHNPPPGTAPKSWCLNAALIAKDYPIFGWDTAGIKAMLEENNCGFWGVRIR